MVNKPKAIGTAGESAVVKACREHGFPHAERRALHGNHDLGDILLAPGIILEVKAGQAAKASSQRLIDEWATQTEIERVNAKAQLAFLVTQRTGYGVGRAQHWWAHTDVATLANLAVGDHPPIQLVAGRRPVQLELRHLLHVLRGAGWGQPIETGSEGA